MPSFVTSPFHTRPHKRLQRLSRIPSTHAIMQILKERSPMPRRYSTISSSLLTSAAETGMTFPSSSRRTRSVGCDRSTGQSATASPPDRAQSVHPARQSDPAQPTPPRPPQSTYPDRLVLYPTSRAGRISVSRIEAGSGAPCRFSITSSSASSPRRGCTTPCHRVNSRASVLCSTGSTSFRNRASDLRRIVRSTSSSHHSR